MAGTPSYRLHVWGWLRGPAQKLIMPNWLAITIGHDIFSWRPMDEFELEHELTHVRQWSANGIMYIPRYFQASRAAAAAGKDRYRDNAFEVEAYTAADTLRAARSGPGPIPANMPPTPPPPAPAPGP
jgi:hypothetical protein